MKRLAVLAAAGVCAAAVTSGAAFAAAGPSDGLRPGEAYAGAGYRGSDDGVQAKAAPAGLQGVDVASHQGPNVNWTALKQSGVRFAIVKATESADTQAKPDQGYTNPHYAAQYNGARNAGLIRGAYHFAQPHESDGARQADFFVNNGGGWQTGGWTLPGVLDIEFNPYDNGLNSCYDLNKTQTVNWIRAFSDRYRARTGRHPIIYTNTAWWKQCTGNYNGFGNHALWLARYDSAPGELPAGWRAHTFWQYAEQAAGTNTGNRNVFNGSQEALVKLAAQARTGFASVNAAPEPVRKGRPSTVTGKLNFYNGTAWRPLAGHKVSFYFKARGSSTWVLKGSMKTTANGSFRKSFTAQKDGTWRTGYAGAPKYFSATSAGDYVDVR